MLPVFILTLMTVLAVSTVIALLTNSLIIVVNLVDKAKGKNFSPSDLIVVTLCVSNIIFQITMLINDYMSFTETEIYFSDEVYSVSVVFLILPIYSSFWFTVCLSINYYLQIVISTHPLLIRLKLAGAQLIAPFVIASVFISLVTGLPAAWNIYRETLYVNTSSNESLEVSFPKLSVAYLLPSNLISCSLPLALVGIANGLIIKSLVTNTHKSDRNTKGERNARAEGRVRAARTISCLLILYICFYISEILVFIDFFPLDSSGFGTCLVVIYSYSPAQSIVLIFGSPKLKQVFLGLLCCLGSIAQEKPRNPTVLFIQTGVEKTVHL
ncbi:taste receptor type 2 member 40-like [Hyperolius riggenbachi]|uniref:taste receptor type 2 member 40-like n=1 Tax=Hyperolius riggenbachi TaxID=752182 RepID=UPI0035A2B98C